MGCALSRVDIQEIRYDDSTAEAMRQQMEAERKARAAILLAKGEAEAKVMIANAEKEAAVIRAEGIAQALEIRAKGEAIYLSELAQTKLTSKDAGQMLLAQKYIEGFQAITEKSGSGDKIYLPNNGTALGLLDASQ